MTRNALRFFQQNLHGFHQSWPCLELILHKHKPHIVAFQEAFRSSHSVDSFCIASSYKSFFSETGRAGFLLRHDVIAQPFRPSQHQPNQYALRGYESCWIKVTIPSAPALIVCSFYRDPSRSAVHYSSDDSPESEDTQQRPSAVGDSNTFDLALFANELQAALAVSPYVLLCMDSNAHHPVWLDCNTDTVGECFHSLFNSEQLTVLNQLPFDETFRSSQGSSSIDITTSSPALLAHCHEWRVNTSFDVTSDHHPITFRVSLGKYVDKPRKSSYTTWNFINADMNRFEKTCDKLFRKWLSDLASDNPGFPSSLPADLEAAVDSWTQLLNSATKDSIPRRRVFRNHKPWWNNKHERLHQKAQRLKREYFRRSKTDAAHANWKSAVKRLKRELRYAKNQWFKGITNKLNDGDPLQMFRTFKRLHAGGPSVIPTLSVPNPHRTEPDSASTPLEKASALCFHFAKPPVPHGADSDWFSTVTDSVAASAVHRKRELRKRHWEPFEKPIQMAELEEALCHANTFSATGPDTVHNFQLKRGGIWLHKSLLFLFQWSFCIGYFPKQWKRFNITPIPKPDRDHSILKNHRPISLLSCTGKLLERIICKRLLWYVTTNEMLLPDQAGFQSWHNTSELLLRLTENIYRSFNTRGVTYAAFLDIASAYDSIWRDGLRYKLRNEYELSGRLYWWLDSFLNHRVGRVVLDGVQSPWVQFNTGVPQGSSLSPLLFLLYINDVHHQVISPTVQMGLFADDMALWAPVYTNDVSDMEFASDSLQTTLSLILKWSQKWRLILAPSKSKCMIFRNNQKRKFHTPSLTLGNTVLQLTPSFKYLGLILDQHLTFREHVEYVLAKASRNLGLITYLCKFPTAKPTLSAYLNLYKSIVRPCMEYASAFWNLASKSVKQRLERIQRTALVRILGVMYQSSYDELNVICQIPPLEMRRQQEAVRLFHRAMLYHKKEPRHNLSRAFGFWRETHREGEVYKWERTRLSTLSYASLHIHDHKIPTPSDDRSVLVHNTPWDRDPVPSGSHCPFPVPMSVSADTVLASLSGDSAVTFWTDGSAFPNPGAGGAGVSIHGPSDLPRSIFRPCVGMVSNIWCEVFAMQLALKEIRRHYQTHTFSKTRLIVFSDCKFVINAIYQRWNSYYCRSEIEKCQAILRSLSNVPELYWVKGHAGIPGNEQADKLAKQAQLQARQNQPDMFSRTAVLIWTNPDLNPYFTTTWNSEWVKSDNSKHTREFFPTLTDADNFSKSILHHLTFHERRTICRIITGKMNVAYYKSKIKRGYPPQCSCSVRDRTTGQVIRPDETVEHFLMECKQLRGNRVPLRSLVKQLTGISLRNVTMPQLVTANFDSLKKKPQKRLQIIRAVVAFVDSTKANPRKLPSQSSLALL